MPDEPKRHPGAPHPPAVIAVGTSAGGLAALGKLLADLPPDFPCPIVVVQHLAATHPSHLAELLGRHARLPVSQAQEGETISPGHVYIAPPDHHLVVKPGGTLALTHTPEERFARPSVDVLFRSVAETYGPGVLAVILTGGGTDGCRGALAVKEAGGRVLAQDREEAMAFSMPEAVVRAGAADEELPLAELALRLIQTCTPEREA